MEEHGYVTASVFLLYPVKVGGGRGRPLCSRSDGVHHLDDAVQGGVCADGHVRAAEVVVDGTHHAHDVQVGRFLCFLFSDPACSRGIRDMGGSQHSIS